MDKDRAKKLDTVFDQIEKQFGEGSLMKLGTDNVKKVPAISTGALSIDLALGIGGIPKGRVVEIYGPESSGKTTLSLHVAAEAQKAGGVAAFIDAEHALDPVYAAALGVDIDELLVSQPDTGEQALEIADMLIESGGVDIVIIDSVAALVPKAEIDGEMGQSHVGIQARLMSQALRKLTGSINKTQTTVIFINQIREKIGVMWGSPETTSGGRALKFYASVRIDIRRIETLKVGAEMIGNRIRAKIVKNKVAPPFREAEFDIMFGKGISREGSLLDVGVEHGIVRKGGAWFTYDEVQLGQGKENSKNYLRENPDLALQLENDVYKAVGMVDIEEEVTKEDIVFFEDMFQPGMESLPYILQQVSEDYRPTIYLRCLAQDVDPYYFVNVWGMSKWMSMYEQMCNEIPNVNILATNEEMVAHMRIANWPAPIYNISGLSFGKEEVQERVPNRKAFNDRKMLSLIHI